MLEINDIVKVDIGIESTSKTETDLKNIAVLSVHNNFADGELYREYTSTTAMLDDGFLTTDYAYVAAQRIFSQNPVVSSVVVGAIQLAAPEDPVDYVAEITKLQAATEAWFYIITDATDVADIEAIADYIETQDLLYIFSTNQATVIDPLDETDIFSVLKAKSLMHTYGMYIKDNTVKAPESAWVGKFAAYQAGSAAWIHKALATLIPESFTRTEMTTLKNKNAHFYTLVGQDPSVEGTGNVVGGEKIHVIQGVIWTKVTLAEAVWNYLYINNKVNYTNISAEAVRTIILTVLNKGVDYKIFTDDDGFTISIPDVNKLTSQQRASGVLSGITFRARLAGAILFIDGIQGTVYA